MTSFVVKIDSQVMHQYSIHEQIYNNVSVIYIMLHSSIVLHLYEILCTNDYLFEKFEVHAASCLV